MRNANALMVGYIGSDDARRFIIQRGDLKFWTGGGWSKIRDKAKVFTEHKAAQATCAAIQYGRYKGKPVRTFKVDVSITMVADDVANIGKEALAKYIVAAFRIDVETSIHGDGPVDGSYVQARMQMSTMVENRTDAGTVLTLWQVSSRPHDLPKGQSDEEQDGVAAVGYHSQQEHRESNTRW